MRLIQPPREHPDKTTELSIAWGGLRGSEDSGVKGPREQHGTDNVRHFTSCADLQHYNSYFFSKLGDQIPDKMQLKGRLVMTEHGPLWCGLAMGM